MGQRLGYWSLGASVGVIVFEMLALILRHHLVAPNWNSVPGFVSFASCFGVLAINIAVGRGKLKTAEELDRPVSLFPRG